MTSLVKFYTIEGSEKAEFLAGLEKDEFEALISDSIECAKDARAARKIYEEIKKLQKNDEMFIVKLWRKINPSSKVKAEAAYKKLASDVESTIKNSKSQSLKELFDIEIKKLQSECPNVPSDDPGFGLIATMSIDLGIFYEKLIANEIDRRGY